MTRKKPEELRRHRWFGVHDLRCLRAPLAHRADGLRARGLAGKPVIGIVNTWSDINPCHAHFKARVEDVKRGVLQAGGFPLELPAISLAEPFVKPTTMLYRNFLAMETEELLRSHPIDGAVLMGGCDKTTPGLIMGAISHGPAGDLLPAGPMLRGNWRGEELGSGSDTWKYWAELQRRQHHQAGLGRDRGRHRPLCRHLHDHGHGRDHDGDRRGDGPHAARRLLDPRRRRRPSAHVRRFRATHRRDGLGGPEARRHPVRGLRSTTPSAATWRMGGSTNAMIHVVAMARRAGIPLDLQRFDELARQMPVLANVRPSGKYLMEDFFYAGGMRALLAELEDAARPGLPHRQRPDAGREHRTAPRSTTPR